MNIRPIRTEFDHQAALKEVEPFFDLAPMIGRSNRVYEVLAHRRPLTLPMIRRLHTQLGIPAEVLIGLSR